MPIKKQPNKNELTNTNKGLRQYLLDNPATRYRPVGEKEVQKIKEAFEQWAIILSDPETKNRVCTIQQITARLGFRYREILKLIDNYPELKSPYEELKYALASIREQRGLEKTYDASLVAKTMHRFTPEWKEETNKVEDLAAVLKDFAKAAFTKDSNGSGEETKL